MRPSTRSARDERHRSRRRHPQLDYAGRRARRPVRRSAQQARTRSRLLPQAFGRIALQRQPQRVVAETLATAYELLGFERAIFFASEGNGLRATQARERGEDLSVDSVVVSPASSLGFTQRGPANSFRAARRLVRAARRRARALFPLGAHAWRRALRFSLRRRAGPARCERTRNASRPQPRCRRRKP